MTCTQRHKVNYKLFRYGRGTGSSGELFEKFKHGSEKSRCNYSNKQVSQGSQHNTLKIEDNKVESWQNVCRYEGAVQTAIDWNWCNRSMILWYS